MQRFSFLSLPQRSYWSVVGVGVPVIGRDPLREAQKIMSRNSNGNPIIFSTRLVIELFVHRALASFSSSFYLNKNGLAIVENWATH